MDLQLKKVLTETTILTAFTQPLFSSIILYSTKDCNPNLELNLEKTEFDTFWSTFGHLFKSNPSSLWKGSTAQILMNGGQSTIQYFWKEQLDSLIEDPKIAKILICLLARAITYPLLHIGIKQICSRKQNVQTQELDYSGNRFFNFFKGLFFNCLADLIQIYIQQRFASLNYFKSFEVKTIACLTSCLIVGYPLINIRNRQIAAQKIGDSTELGKKIRRGIYKDLYRGFLYYEILLLIVNFAAFKRA